MLTVKELRDDYRAKKTALQSVIAASGFRVSALVHYAPDCNDKGYAAWTCSVFSNNRNGGGTKWCARVDESAIDECDMPIPKPAPGAAHVSVRPPVITGQKIPDKPGGKTNCHRISCGLGACERVCSPPS